MKKQLLLYAILFLNLNFAFSQWNQVGQTLTGTRLLFGESVSISGNGMRIATVDAINNGYVNVYEFQGTTWQPVGNPIGPLFDGGGNNPLDLDYDGDRLVVSGFNGNVEVYERDASNGSWTQIGNTIYGETVDHEIGRAVALNRAGNVLSIGASGTDSDGNYSVKVYQLVNDIWTLVDNPIVFGSNITPWYYTFYNKYNSFMEFSETGRLAVAFPYDTGQ